MQPNTVSLYIKNNLFLTNITSSDSEVNASPRFCTHNLKVYDNINMYDRLVFEIPNQLEN